MLLEGRVSDVLDVARPSTRLLLEDADAVSDTARLYAAVIVPARASAPTPVLLDLQIDQTGDEIGCTFDLNGTAYAFAWTATGLARRI